MEFLCGSTLVKVPLLTIVFLVTKCPFVSVVFSEPRVKRQKTSARMTLKQALDEQAHKEGFTSKQLKYENAPHKNVLKETNSNQEEQQKWLGALALMELAQSVNN